MITLRNKIAFYVPATYGNLLERSLDIAERFANLFGGSTITDATGLYTLETGEVVTEKVKIVYAYTNNDTLDANREAIIDLAIESRDAWQQESIALELDNTLILV